MSSLIVGLLRPVGHWAGINKIEDGYEAQYSPWNEMIGTVNKVLFSVAPYFLLSQLKNASFDPITFVWTSFFLYFGMVKVMGRVSTDAGVGSWLVRQSIHQIQGGINRQSIGLAVVCLSVGSLLFTNKLKFIHDYKSFSHSINKNHPIFIK